MGSEEPVKGERRIERPEQGFFLSASRLDRRGAHDREPVQNQHAVLDEYRIRVGVVRRQSGDFHPALP
jgi:hypothetical protein